MGGATSWSSPLSMLWDVALHSSARAFAHLPDELRQLIDDVGIP